MRVRSEESDRAIVFACIECLAHLRQAAVAITAQVKALNSINKCKSPTVCAITPSYPQVIHSVSFIPTAGLALKASPGRTVGLEILHAWLLMSSETRRSDRQAVTMTLGSPIGATRRMPERRFSEGKGLRADADEADC